MSVPVGSTIRRHSPADRRGQSLVEFVLVLPILMVLFLGIADVGRVFSAGIVIEAAARDAAEIVAEEYRRNPPGPLSDPAPPGDPAYYQPLHDLAATTVCDEARSLPNTTYNAGTRECTLADGDPSTPDAMPVMLICIHDGEDPLCDVPAFGATVPPDCSELLSPINPTMDGGTEDSRYVEVRICYMFSTLVHVPILTVGNIWLQKDRAFTVADYPVPTPSIPPAPSAPPPTALPTPEPTPSPSPSPSPSESPSPSASPSASTAPSDTPTPTAEPTPEPVPTATPSPSPGTAP
jgi:hypothetical protein